MALFIRPQTPTLISSSHADLKSCTPTCPRHPPKTEILKNILSSMPLELFRELNELELKFVTTIYNNLKVMVIR